MAAPHVAGVAALIISRTATKRMAPSAVASALIATALPKACPKRERGWLNILQLLPRPLSIYMSHDSPAMIVKNTKRFAAMALARRQLVWDSACCRCAWMMVGLLCL